jgi:hypothetical protein
LVSDVLVSEGPDADSVCVGFALAVGFTSGALAQAAKTRTAAITSEINLIRLFFIPFASTFTLS